MLAAAAALMVVALAMHHVLLHALRVHRLEGPQTDVQRDLRGFDAAGAERGEHLQGEMQAGGGGGNGAARARVDRLVALAVGRLVGPRDVRGQRHVPDLLHRRQKIRHRREPQGAFAEAAARHHLRREFVVRPEVEPLADPDLAPRVHQRLPGVGFAGQRRGQQRFHLAVEKLVRRRVARAERLRAHPLAAAEEARWKYPGVVQHQQVAGAQELGQLAKPAVCKLLPGCRKLLRGPHQVQQTRSRAFCRGLLRDELGRQLVIEVRDLHAAILGVWRARMRGDRCPKNGAGPRRPAGPKGSPGTLVVPCHLPQHPEWKPR